MTNRILIGKRGSDYGIWVSKPTKDVLTATDAEMLMSSYAYSFQVLMTGMITLNSSLVGSITIPDFGYKPYLLVSSSVGVTVRWNSNTSLDVNGRDQVLRAGTNYLLRDVHYAVVTRQALP